MWWKVEYGGAKWSNLTCGGVERRCGRVSLDAKHFIGEHTPKIDDKGRLFAALVLLSLTGVLIFAATSWLSHLLLRRWHESAVRREN